MKRKLLTAVFAAAIVCVPAERAFADGPDPAQFDGEQEFSEGVPFIFVCPSGETSIADPFIFTPNFRGHFTSGRAFPNAYGSPLVYMNTEYCHLLILN